MMRELFSKRLGLAVAAGLGLAAAASTASAAPTATFELRAVSGGSTGTVVDAKNANVTANGQTIRMQVWAVITDGDGNHQNDGFQVLHTAVNSTESASGPLGNFTTIGTTTPRLFAPSAGIDTGTSRFGGNINRDANPDLEIGGSDPNVDSSGWIVASGGVSGMLFRPADPFAEPPDPGLGVAGAGTTSLQLGTIQWTYSGTGGGSTQIQLDPRVITGGAVGQDQVLQWFSDAAQNNGVFVATKAKPSDQGTLFTFGAPVVINAPVVPEPASLGLLGLGAVGLLARRRRA